ncbi:transposase [Nonomuraea sp. NPDC003214]
MGSNPATPTVLPQVEGRFRRSEAASSVSGAECLPDGRVAGNGAVGDQRDEDGEGSQSAAFAMHCGAAPRPASSGRTDRRRPNCGGDHQANCALHRIVLCRMRGDTRTRDHVARRAKDDRSERDIIRRLKLLQKCVYEQVSAFGGSWAHAVRARLCMCATAWTAWWSPAPFCRQSRRIL